MIASKQVVDECDGYRRVYVPVRGLERDDVYFLTEIEKVESIDEEDNEAVHD